MKRYILTLIFLTLIVSVFTATCRIFDTSFAEVTIDWFAFLAGIFLVVEATYRLFTDPYPVVSVQISRVFRAIIGTCVFTIHILQFMRK